MVKLNKISNNFQQTNEQKNSFIKSIEEMIFNF